MTATTIRPAIGYGDVHAVTRVLADSVDWIGQKGLDQWQSGFADPGKVWEGVERGWTWMLHHGPRHQLAGTITLAPGSDPVAVDRDFWSLDDPMTARAMYVSKVALAEGFHGHDLGSLMLDWACWRAGRLGFGAVRLDAWKTNHDLHAYYRRRGWHDLGIVDLPHRRSGALFERRASLIRPALAEELYVLPTWQPFDTTVSADEPVGDHIEPGADVHISNSAILGGSSMCVVGGQTVHGWALEHRGAGIGCYVAFRPAGKHL